MAGRLQEWMNNYDLQPITSFIRKNNLQADAEKVFRVARTLRYNVVKHDSEWYENGKKVEL